MRGYEYNDKIDLKKMETFVESLQNFSTQFESLGLKRDLNSRMLLTQVRRKLPEEHRIQFLQSINDGKSTESLPSLVKWLHSRLVLLQKAKGPSEQNAAPRNKSPGKNQRSANHSMMSPGNKDTNRNMNNDTPSKCPLHPKSTNHFLKGCYKFRTLPQAEKFNIMNKNAICHRCGHNNCKAGKRPFNHEECEFIRECQVPACGRNTHFSSICPCVYGLDGYRHFDRNNYTSTSTTPMNSTTNAAPKTLDPGAQQFQPAQPGTYSASREKMNTDNKGQITCALPTIMANLRYGAKKTSVRVLLDTGSQISLVREGVIPKSRKDKMQNFNLTTVGGDTVNYNLRVVDCVLESLDGSFTRKIHLTEMRKPCGDASIVTNAQISQYSHLEGVEVVEALDNTIDVLLGIENADILTSEQRILGPSSKDPVAIKCPLGWYIQGGKSTNDVITNAIVHFVQVAATGELEEFMGIDRAGLEPKRCKCEIDQQDRIATERMQESVTKLEDGTYQVNLPWKKSPENLPNNYDYAVKRLMNLEKQFKNKPLEWEIYCKQMNDQLTRGVSRLVPASEMTNDLKEGKKMWFLPHFGVLKADSQTTPVRVVYDGKASYQGHSLNEYLAKGDNMNTSLFDVALRFREYEVGIIADISKMFQAVKVSPDDARFHRYVFRECPEDPIQVYELRTVTFGDKPSPAAATIVLRHAARENAPDKPDILRTVSNQFYVDDLNESVRNVEDAVCLKQDLISTLEKGNFNIRKFLSNKKEICDAKFYPDDDKIKALGTIWNLRDDTLHVKEVNFNDFSPTKRNILKKTAAYYDIFGMLAGMLVRPKILLQKLWTFNIDWDTPIHTNSDLHAMLDAIKVDFKEIGTIKVDRCLIPEKYKDKTPLPSVSLHGASDASEDAMGMGIWLRWSQDEEEEAELSFVCARARLTPLKQTSMPRKELQAILLLSRLMLNVENALRLEITYKRIWTDSMTAISWLKGQSKSYRSYVACRVGEITSEFDPNRDITYVPSEQNTIDFVSRGVKASEMKKVIDGPAFLRKPPDMWPEMPKHVPVDSDVEKKKFHVRNAKVLSVNVTKEEPILDPTRFSSWPRLLMVTARILSLKDLPKKEWLKKLTEKLSQWPSLKRIKEAELYWIRQAQKDINFEDSHVLKLNPFVDDKEHVFRVGGRIQNAPLSYDIRHPYLLPKKCHISLLIARQKHREVLHGGHLKTCAEIRKTYWIVGDTSLSKRIISDCTVCRRHRGKHLRQQMSDLPINRVMPFSPPFSTTMVDYLGPINVKLNRNTVTKGYCVVFVCTVLGAVHLTCVQDLSTSAFLQALERFTSTRGAPALIISDNATCFRGANNEIRELQLCLNQSELRAEAQKFKINWKFGPPGGPHHQGQVERMVQEVKKSMRHLVKADKLTFVEWETVFSIIAGLLNNRPISALSSSPLDDPPITPNHFLIGRGNLPNPQIPCEKYVGNLRKRRELCNSMVDGFWRRWMLNIHKLSPRQKWNKKMDNLMVGDIVLVIQDNVPRGMWKIAEVVAAYVNNGLVRVVDVKFADGNVLKRPITKLVLLLAKAERLDM